MGHPASHESTGFERSRNQISEAPNGIPRNEKNKSLYMKYLCTFQRTTCFFFFAKFGEVSNVSPIKRKAKIATTDVEIMVTVTRKNFMEIPNTLICERDPIYVVLEGRQPL